jgi:HlyD family secretion protein
LSLRKIDPIPSIMKPLAQGVRSEELPSEGTMDKPRTGQAQKRRRRNTILIVLGLVVVVAISLGLSRLPAAAPTVERSTLYIDTVKRGEMLREVRGPGTLVPVDIRWISAQVEGRVERIPNLPGVTVTANTVLLEMTDPVVEQNMLEAESQLKAAEAQFENLRAQLASQLLNQESQVTAAQSQAAQAKLQAEADQALFKDQLIPELNLKLSRLRATQTGEQARIERERFEKNKKSNEAQLAAQQAQVDQFRSLYGLRRRQLDFLKVRAGIPGVLQELPVQVGQRVTPGTTLARVARPEQLKAQLHIPETQAKDVTVGQKASIDTRNGLIAGRVIRVNPSVQEGTVTVDVALEGALPPGARVDLSVDGTIEIERLPNVLYVGRPMYGQANSKVELFKLVDGGKAAQRVAVQLGSSSVNTIEIKSGLQPGDQVILSDTSAQDGFDRLRLN